MTTAAEAPPTTDAPAEPAGGTTVAQMFKFSTWIHVGPGSEECEAVDEDQGTVDCSNPLHFHAWCTLPNQFQHREIQKVALAAKARKGRQMRHEGSDAYEVLEEELDFLLRQGESAREAMIDEIVGKDWWRDYLEAVKDVAELEVDEGGEPTKPYATIAQDRLRLKELEETPEDERESDEFDELKVHVGVYHQRVQERAKEIVEPKRAALKERALPELVDLIRSDRIDRDSNEEFAHVYAEHAWFHGVRKAKGPNAPRCFETLDAMHKAAPEVLDAIQAAWKDMEQATQEVSAEGNS